MMNLWCGEFFDLCDLRVSDDVMEYDNLWISVKQFFLEWSDVEDGDMTSVATDHLIAVRPTHLHPRIPC